MQVPSQSCASPRSVRSSARFTGDLLKHDDQYHVANRQIAVRVYLLRSLDPAARVRVVASLGEIRLQSNHDSPPRPSTQRLLLKDRGKGV